MAQTAAIKRQVPGSTIDYTPSSAVTAGDVVIVGDIVGVASGDIAANAKGSLDVEGVFDLPKTSAVFAVGDNVYWSATGTPVTGTAGSGAASLETGKFAGVAVEAAITGASYVLTKLKSSKSRMQVPTTVAATGSTQADAAQLVEGHTLVSAADATKGVKLPAAAAGKQVSIKNGANAVLKVWPATGDAINAIAANSNYVLAAYTSVILISYDGTTWHSIPLVAS
jgi:predicted RecA/RadA family phage recombinase